MKKLIKFIIGLVLFVVFVAIIIGIIIGVLLYDNSHKGEKENITTTEVVSSINYNALETTKNESKLSYTLDVLTLNQLLGNLSDSINLSPLKITNMYTTFDNLDDEDLTNDTITLYVPMKIYFYNSCLIATINIEESTDSFTLVISQAKIGKVDSNFFAIKKTLEKAFDPKLVQNELSKQGYETTCEYNNGNFLITMEKKEIFNVIEENIKENSLYQTLIDVIKNNPSLYEIKFSGEAKGFIINLKDLASVIPSDKSFEASNPEDNAITKAESLLKNNIITKEQVPYAVDFLVRGYQNIDEETKTEIKKINFSTVGIPYVELYNGIVDRKDTSILTVIASSVADMSLLSPGVNVNIDDDNINAIIDDADIIGKTFSFQKDNKINYISIGNIYIKTSYHQIVLTTLVDLNGKELKMDVTLDASNVGNGYQITTTLKKVEIGSISFNEDEQKSLLEFLNNNIDLDILKITPSTKTVILDFDSYFKDKSLIALNALEGHLNKQIEVYDGYIQVRLKPSII